MPNFAGAQDLTDIARRMEKVAVAGGYEAAEGPDANTTTPNQRWAIDARWVTFECGCVAERCRELVDPQPSDPIIFANLPQQAVYESVCHLHGPSMNFRLGMGGIKDFDQWRIWRRNRLMGRVK
jgi:hypothetical protein